MIAASLLPYLTSKSSHDMLGRPVIPLFKRKLSR